MNRKSLSLQNRRQTLKLLGAAGAAALVAPHGLPAAAEAATANCSTTTPQVTQGPYWVDEKLFRSDIRTDPTTEVAREGIPLALTITVVNSNANCAPH